MTSAGNISAVGSAANPIYFTSAQDDDKGGDTTSNGASTPHTGDWGYVQITSASSTFNNVIFRYGGSSAFSPTANIYQTGGTLNIISSTSTKSASYGVDQTSGTLNIAACELSSSTYGADITGGSATFNATSTIKNNTQYGIYDSSSGSLTVASTTFSGNATSSLIDPSNGLTFNHWNNVASGTGIGGFEMHNYTNTATWSGADFMPYVIGASGFLVNSGQTLTINPGAIIKMATTSTFTVNGTLNTTGTGSFVTIFTSLKDDGVDVDRDTNGDGTATAPAPGDWRGITVSSTGSTTLASVIVRYGGASTTIGEITNQGGRLTINQNVNIPDRQSEVLNSANYGIYTNSGTTNVSSTTISSNKYGYVHVGGTSNVQNNFIFSNSFYGVYNFTTSAINAENNYWPPASGTTTGPYNATSNPSGNGDAVSDHVDFTPWMDYHSLWGHFAVDVLDRNMLYAVVDNGQFPWPQWYPSVATWNAEGKIAIATTTLFSEDLQVSDTNQSDKSWNGLTSVGSPYTLQLNMFYLENDSSNQIQNTITHELGHSLGLWHSFLGNIMYAVQTSQTALGNQDKVDYHDLWGY